MDLDEGVGSEVPNVTPETDLFARFSHLLRSVARIPRTRRKCYRWFVGVPTKRMRSRVWTKSGHFRVCENVLWGEAMPGASLTKLSATLSRGVTFFSRFQLPVRQRWRLQNRRVEVTNYADRLTRERIYASHRSSHMGGRQ